MAGKEDEHPIISDVRNIRGHGPEVSHQEIYETEARRMAALSPRDRAVELREFQNRTHLYDQRQTSLRQKAQAHRFESYLRTADQRLKAAGR
jgi:hypothetical protein